MTTVLQREVALKEYRKLLLFLISNTTDNITNIQYYQYTILPIYSQYSIKVVSTKGLSKRIYNNNAGKPEYTKFYNTFLLCQNISAKLSISACFIVSCRI